MKKILLIVVSCAVVIAALGGAWYTFLRPETARVLASKQRSFGDILFTLERGAGTLVEVWEFRQNGVLYIALEWKNDEQRNRDVQSAQLDAAQRERVQHIASIAPTSAYYRCVDEGKQQVEDVSCDTQQALILRIGNCSVKRGCSPYEIGGSLLSDYAAGAPNIDPVAKEMNETLKALLRDESMPSF